MALLIASLGRVHGHAGRYRHTIYQANSKLSWQNYSTQKSTKFTAES